MNSKKELRPSANPAHVETATVEGQAALLLRIADDKQLMEVGRKAIEDTLVQWRDDRLSTLMRNNGFTIRERDGSESSIIRFGPEAGVSIALRAIADHVANSEPRSVVGMVAAPPDSPSPKSAAVAELVEAAAQVVDDWGGVEESTFFRLRSALEVVKTDSAFSRNPDSTD